MARAHRLLPHDSPRPFCSPSRPLPIADQPFVLRRRLSIRQNAAGNVSQHIAIKSVAPSVPAPARDLRLWCRSAAGFLREPHAAALRAVKLYSEGANVLFSNLLTYAQVFLGVLLALCCLFVAIHRLPAVIFFLTRPLRSTPAGRLLLWAASVWLGVWLLRWLAGAPQTPAERLTLFALAVFARLSYDLYGLRRLVELRNLEASLKGQRN